MEEKPVTSVPAETARQLCAELQETPWFSYRRWWCWGCTTFGGSDPARRCGAVVACPQVLERYQRRPKS